MTAVDSLADSQAILGLMNLPRVGSVTIHRILAVLAEQGTAPRFLLEYDTADLVEAGLLTEPQAALFVSEEQREWRTGMIAQLSTTDVRLIPVTSEAYPPHLRDKGPAMAPPLLMTLGNLDSLQEPGIAFAGARHASGLGLELTRTLASGAVEKRFTVVSGGAAGIDAAAHDEALSRGGSTVVVLAEGILSARACKLSVQQEEGQCAIVSAFLPDDGWAAWRAMERNRYILGLCERLIVIEAGERGGTLAAGREALNAGRETWVLDYIDPPESASGNRLLLDLGARPIPVSADGEIEIPPGVFAIGNWVVNPVRG